MYLRNKVRRTDEHVISRNKLRDDLIINLAAQSPITDMLHAENALASRSEHAPSGISAGAYDMNPKTNPVLNLMGADERVRVAALNKLLEVNIWPVQGLFTILKFYSVNRLQ